MTCWDYIMVFGGYAAVIWWAYTGNFEQEKRDEQKENA